MVEFFTAWRKNKLDSHMAPYGACEVAQSTARSKAQFEADRFRKGFRKKNKHCRTCFRRKRKHVRKCFRRKNKTCIRSNAQFEADRFRKGLRRKNKHGRKCFRRKKKQARKCFRRKKEACPSSDFERSLASKHARAVISNAQWPRRKKKHAQTLTLVSSAQCRQSMLEHRFRAAISIARWLRSTLEQSFRAPSGYGARLSTDFERIMRKHCACAVFSKAQPSKVGSYSPSRLPPADLSGEFNI